MGRNFVIIESWRRRGVEKIKPMNKNHKGDFHCFDASKLNSSLSCTAGATTPDYDITFLPLVQSSFGENRRRIKNTCAKAYLRPRFLFWTASVCWYNYRRPIISTVNTALKKYWYYREWSEKFSDKSIDVKFNFRQVWSWRWTFFWAHHEELLTFLRKYIFVYKQDDK